MPAEYVPSSSGLGALKQIIGYSIPPPTTPYTLIALG